MTKGVVVERSHVYINQAGIDNGFVSDAVALMTLRETSKLKTGSGINSLTANLKETI